MAAIKENNLNHKSNKFKHKIGQPMAKHHKLRKLEGVSCTVQTENSEANYNDNTVTTSITPKQKTKEPTSKHKKRSELAQISNVLKKSNICQDETKNTYDERAVKIENCKLQKRNSRIKYRKLKRVPRKNDSDDGQSKDADKPERIKLPSKPEEISCNWMKLSQTIVKRDVKSFEHGNTRKKEKNEIWFDDVDKVFLESEEPTNAPTAKTTLVKDNAFKGLTQVVGLDCEMVGVGDNGRESHLARVSIVNQFGHCILDKFVTPQEKVTDYRTQFSGIRPGILKKKGEPFKTVVQEVSDILKGRTLVGHALSNDLRVLFLSHPRRHIRDTSRYKPFRTLFKGQIPSLKKLSEKLLGVKIQDGEHDSVQDAQAAMRIYTMHKKDWEKELKRKHRPRKPEKTNDST